MKTINLRDYYSFYTSDCFIEVPDEVAYHLRTYRHKAYYFLDRAKAQSMIFCL